MSGSADPRIRIVALEERMAKLEARVAALEAPPEEDEEETAPTKRGKKPVYLS